MKWRQAQIIKNQISYKSPPTVLQRRVESALGLGLMTPTISAFRSLLSHSLSDCLLISLSDVHPLPFQPNLPIYANPPNILENFVYQKPIGKTTDRRKHMCHTLRRKMILSTEYLNTSRLERSPETVESLIDVKNKQKADMGRKKLEENCRRGLSK